MVLDNHIDDVFNVKIVCCLIVVNDVEKIVSLIVLKFSKIEIKILPKKKKKHQKKNKI